MISYGSLPKIDWICFNSSSGTVTNNIDSTVWTGLSGSQTATSVAASETFTLACSGPGGTTTTQVVANMASAPTVTPGPGAQANPFSGLEITNPFSGQIKTLDDLFGAIIGFLYYIAGPIVVIMIIIAGLLFLFSRGDPNKVQTAKRLLLYAIIGLAIILIGHGFVVLLENILALGS